MEALVIGGTKQQRALIEQAAVYYSSILLDKSSADLFINIKLNRDLLTKEGAKADCMLDEDECDYQVFEIRIDSLMNMPAILRSLAHEMVHVTQYYTGRIKDVSSNSVMWNGKLVNTIGLHYYDLPWEVEAYGKETGLFERFVTRKKLGRAKWYVDKDYL